MNTNFHSLQKDFQKDKSYTLKALYSKICLHLTYLILPFHESGLHDREEHHSVSHTTDGLFALSWERASLISEVSDLQCVAVC